MARIGSKPQTPFRGTSAIFGTLIEDHDEHRRILAALSETRGQSTARQELFAEMTFALKGHAAAEEQAVWSTVLRKPEITEQGRHAVAEHKEIDDMLNALAATSMASGAWLVRFSALREEYLHHIREEEQELFVAVDKHLTADDRVYMDGVFKRRKLAETDAAEITPRLKAVH